MIQPKYWLALHPDVHKPIGGVKQMHRLAECLLTLNREVHIIQDSAEFHPGWFSSSVATISYADWKSLRPKLRTSENILILPETFINVFKNYAPGLPKIIFNQNGSYSFGSSLKSSLSPSDVLSLYDHHELLHILCVSSHDYHLIVDGFSIPDQRVSLIVNSIETHFFLPSNQKKLQLSFMPRKNFMDSRAVLSMLERKPWFSGWHVQPISGCTQNQVLQHLQDTAIFLAFGHPEGFGLPLAEAAACGCALVGYSGLGGKEIFSLTSPFGVTIEVEYGNWLGFITACERLISSLNIDSHAFSKRLLDSSHAVRNFYSFDKMLNSVRSSMAQWESALSSNN